MFLPAIIFLFISSGIFAQPRVQPQLPSPELHAFHEQHHTKPPELSLYSSSTIANIFSPGFAAVRGLNSYAPQTWIPLLDLYLNSTAEGGLGLANMIWPGYSVAFSENWPALATLLASRGIPATDLGGFVPGGLQDFDVVANAPLYPVGLATMGPLFLGFDMGEQDVRYLWGYASNANQVGPSGRFESLVAFADFSNAIEQKSAGILASLQSSVYAVHHWHKSGLYTLAGAETSQSNGNAQVHYSFLRGAAKQYGTLWYGQVSIFNRFGCKSPGDENPSPNCTSQSDHSPVCGTSLSLMKRLMYTQLAYSSAYFAYEGGLTYDNNTITPIGTLQASAMAFFMNESAAAVSAAAVAAAVVAEVESEGERGGGKDGKIRGEDYAGSKITSPLGVHVPTIAIIEDFMGGWVRPCDASPSHYAPNAWGTLPWDTSDYLFDAVLDAVYPGYRAGSNLHNETGYISSTPFGDAVDVLLSDAIPSVLAAYDTIVLAHRAETAAGDLAQRLTAYIAGGGKVFTTASTLLDMANGAGGGQSLLPPAFSLTSNCVNYSAGTEIALAGGGAGSIITEPLPFLLCPLTKSTGASWEVLATTDNGATPVAVRISLGNGSLTVVTTGSYGMTPQVGTPAPYGCGIDEPDTRGAQPYAMLEFVRYFLNTTLSVAALFDLGVELAWVPQRVGNKSYVLTITNPTLIEAPLTIASLIGPIAFIEVFTINEEEKTGIGYLPYGYENVDVGNTTNTTLAGGDTILIRVTLEEDSTTIAPTPAGPPPSSVYARRRLLCLPPGTGDLRRAILARPLFDSTFGGILLDWQYVWSRSPEALAQEAVWLGLRGVTIVVDFSSATNLFPGLRLCDDMGIYYNQSITAIQNVLGKMPLLGAVDALLTLHGTSEIAPANFSSQQDYEASMQATLETLSGSAAASGNITLHLRRSTRNNNIIGPYLSSQVAFAVNASIKFAPSLAYASLFNDGADQAAALFNTSASPSPMASILLLSAAWTSPVRSSEGAPLTTLPPSYIPWLQTVHAAASQANAWIVLDAAYPSDPVLALAAELADVRYLEGILGILNN